MSLDKKESNIILSLVNNRMLTIEKEKLNSISISVPLATEFNALIKFKYLLNKLQVIDESFVDELSTVEFNILVSLMDEAVKQNRFKGIIKVLEDVKHSFRNLFSYF